jgi:hypothetical protein
MQGLPGFDVRTAAELLADAARYERMADALDGNDALAGNLRALAAEARARAAQL